MVVDTLPHTQIQPSFVAAPSAQLLVSPKARIVVDASCELDPALAQALNILVLPRSATIDGKRIRLNAQQTLHHSCWPTPPRKVVCEPVALSELSAAYQQVLGDGLSVVALLLPAALDPTTRTVLTVRSILLASIDGRIRPAPRIAVCEIASIGAGFARLVELTARGAVEGFDPHQLHTLLDRLQVTLRSVYLTGPAGPPRSLCLKGSPTAMLSALIGEQLWTIDRGLGVFKRQLGRHNLATTLFQAGILAADFSPEIVTVTQPALLDRVNTGRVQQQLPALEAQPGGFSLNTYFPHGCLELAALLDAERIEQLMNVIRRVDQPGRTSRSGRREE